MGYTNGRFFGFGVLFTIVAVLFGILYGVSLVDAGRMLSDFFGFASNNLVIVSAGVALLTVVFLTLSYILSVRTYQRRDF
ncbi:MAG: hypothetical protein LBU61_01395 [Coriobacteriales bacterium]|nr:hypothetical protein [Coriobacteriales bacterium]